MQCEHRLKTRLALFAGHRLYLKQSPRTCPVVYCIQASTVAKCLSRVWFTMTDTSRRNPPRSDRLGQIEMPIPFEIIIERTPLSQQADPRHLRAWRQEVQSVVGQMWDAEPPFVGEVMVVITYYFKGGALDVDNMPKPIFDALNGLVYA